MSFIKLTYALHPNFINPFETFELGINIHFIIFIYQFNHNTPLQVIVQAGRKQKAHHLNHTRTKRSISSARHVEALVVADSSMVDFHRDGDVETYLLTIMNMVSSLYKDPAIGNLIKIIVVKIVLLEEDESHPDFNVTHIAENNLHNFCRYTISILTVGYGFENILYFVSRWQRQENPKNDDDPHHHDVAILITRKDICSANGCTLVYLPFYSCLRRAAFLIRISSSRIIFTE